MGLPMSTYDLNPFRGYIPATHQGHLLTIDRAQKYARFARLRLPVRSPDLHSHDFSFVSSKKMFNLVQFLENLLTCRAPFVH